jgi:hypothetical protein
MTDDLPGLSTALHERVRDEHPDLDRLISVSTRAGTRLRRRRTAAASIGGALAVVAVVGIVGVSLGGGGTPGSGPGVATHAPASTRADELENLQQMDGRLDAPSSSEHGVTGLDQLRNLGDEGQANAEMLPAQQLPVHVDPSLRGWQIGVAGDDKFPATKDRHLISVNVRPLSERDAWSSTDPDHPADQVVHEGDNYFVTVQPLGEGVPQSLVDELVAALRFEPTWKK